MVEVVEARRLGSIMSRVEVWRHRFGGLASPGDRLGDGRGFRSPAPGVWRGVVEVETVEAIRDDML